MLFLLAKRYEKRKYGMLWQIEFDEHFKASLDRTKLKPAQKEALLGAITMLATLKNPFERGGKHLRHWAYRFGSDSLLHCKIDEERMVIRIIDVTF